MSLRVREGGREGSREGGRDQVQVSQVFRSTRRKYERNMASQVTSLCCVEPERPELDCRVYWREWEQRNGDCKCEQLF